MIDSECFSGSQSYQHKLVSEVVWSILDGFKIVRATNGNEEPKKTWRRLKLWKYQLDRYNGRWRD